MILLAEIRAGMPPQYAEWLARYAAVLTFLVCIGISLAVFYVYCFCRIFKRTGRHWALGLLVLLPFGEIIVPAILAFAKWPAVKGRGKK